MSCLSSSPHKRARTHTRPYGRRRPLPKEALLPSRPLLAVAAVGSVPAVGPQVGVTRPSSSKTCSRVSQRCGNGTSKQARASRCWPVTALEKPSSTSPSRSPCPNLWIQSLDVEEKHGWVGFQHTGRQGGEQRPWPTTKTAARWGLSGGSSRQQGCISSCQACTSFPLCRFHDQAGGHSLYV